MSYIGIVTATSTQCLLGGVKQHTSSRFQAEDDARNWVALIMEGNQYLNIPCSGDVFSVNKKPELFHCSHCGHCHSKRIIHKC